MATSWKGLYWDLGFSILLLEVTIKLGTLVFTSVGYYRMLSTPLNNVLVSAGDCASEGCHPGVTDRVLVKCERLEVRQGAIGDGRCKRLHVAVTNAVTCRDPVGSDPTCQLMSCRKVPHIRVRRRVRCFFEILARRIAENRVNSKSTMSECLEKEEGNNVRDYFGRK